MDGNTRQDLEELTQPLLPGGHDDQFSKWSYCLPIRSHCWKTILPQYLIVACGVPPSAHEARQFYISNFAYCYGWDFLIQLAFCYPSLGTFLFSITSFYSA